RWRVENSWGTKVHGLHRSIDNKEIPGKGYGTATDAWVDNNVFSAIVRKKYLTEAQLKGLKTQPIELPIDDRMI
ncbi:C1 family peptidase, partial [Corynebacterium sp. HMSC077D10]